MGNELPSYSFSTDDNKIDISQLGFQSLFAPDMAISRLAKLLYYIHVGLSIQGAAPRATRIWLSGFLLATLAIVAFGNMFGDLPPGSRLHIGPGAFIWFFALAVAAFASFPPRRAAAEIAE